MNVHRIVNSIFESNTYILWTNSPLCYIVDCGDIEPILNFIGNKKLIPNKIFLTHGHFDHIYGLNELTMKFSDIEIFASEHTQLLLQDIKLNFSKFHEHPFVFEGNNDKLRILSDGKMIDLWPGQVLETVWTPGHDAGCMSFLTKDYFFTGDSFIPGIKTVTNLRGNKQQAVQSEAKIKAIIAERGVTVCPGHGEIKN